MAWASDDWRSKRVFNFNNKLLVELRLLYMCRDASVAGTPIATFFSVNLPAFSQTQVEPSPGPGERVVSTIASSFGWGRVEFDFRRSKLICGFRGAG